MFTMSPVQSLQVVFLWIILLPQLSTSLLDLNPNISYSAAVWKSLNYLYGELKLTNVVWMIEKQTIVNYHSILIAEFSNIYQNNTVSVSFEGFRMDSNSAIWINIFHHYSDWKIHAQQLIDEKPLELYVQWTPQSTDIEYRDLPHIYNFMITKQMPYSVTHNNCHHVIHELWLLFTNTEYEIPDAMKLRLLQLVQRSTHLLVDNVAFYLDPEKLYPQNRFQWKTDGECPERWNNTEWLKYRLNCLQYYPENQYAPKRIYLRQMTRT
eukprot:173197_1